jgi:hypothetical protein
LAWVKNTQDVQALREIAEADIDQSVDRKAACVDYQPYWAMNGGKTAFEGMGIALLARSQIQQVEARLQAELEVARQGEETKKQAELAQAAKRKAADPPSPVATPSVTSEPSWEDKATQIVGEWMNCSVQYRALKDSFKEANAILAKYRQSGGELSLLDRAAACFREMWAAQTIIAKGRECSSLSKAERQASPYDPKMNKIYKDIDRSIASDRKSLEKLARKLEPLCFVLQERVKIENE